MDYPDIVNVIELDSAPFKCARDAIAYAKAHGIVGVRSNADTNGKGDIDGTDAQDQADGAHFRFWYNEIRRDSPRQVLGKFMRDRIRLNLIAGGSGVALRIVLR